MQILLTTQVGKMIMWSIDELKVELSYNSQGDSVGCISQNRLGNAAYICYLEWQVTAKSQRFATTKDFLYSQDMSLLDYWVAVLCVILARSPDEEALSPYFQDCRTGKKQPSDFHIVSLKVCPEMADVISTHICFGWSRSFGHTQLKG